MVNSLSKQGLIPYPCTRQVRILKDCDFQVIAPLSYKTGASDNVRCTLKAQRNCDNFYSALEFKA